MATNVALKMLLTGREGSAVADVRLSESVDAD